MEEVIIFISRRALDKVEVKSSQVKPSTDHVVFVFPLTFKFSMTKV